MIEQIDREEITRVFKAIINVRYIATHAKAKNLLTSVKMGEDIVRVLDAWRKYCYVSEGMTILSGFHYAELDAEGTLDLFNMSRLYLAQLKGYCTKDKQKSYTQEYHQVELLISDVMTFIANQIKQVGINA